MMNLNIYKAVFFVSVCLNVIISIPALIIVCVSANVRFEIYHGIARKFNRPQIAFVGDSLIRGGAIWSYKLRRLKFDTLNYGRDGLTTDQLKGVIQGMDTVPPIVLVMAGSNDPNKTIEGAYQSFNNYKAALKLLQTKGANPVIQLTLYRQNDQNPDFVDTLNTLLMDYAKHHNLRTLNLNPLLSEDRSLLPQYTTDGLHLNGDAYKIWANQLKPLIALD